MTTIPVASRPVLADLLTRSGSSAVRSAVVNTVLVLTGTALVALLGQVAVPLPFTPVPLTLGTFGALVVGASLGPARAAASLGLYLVAGVAGVGWFADGASGWMFASFGYIIGFLVAGVVAGALARRGADRNVWATIGVMLAGAGIVYLFGLPWLAVFLGVDLPTALQLGLVPFLIGDVIKAVLAALLLPGAWALTARLRP